MNRNVLGLKRVIELLDAQTHEAFRYEPFLELARGAYHRERGEIGEALRHLERSLELLGPEQLLSRPIALSALAETLLDAGQLDRAEEAANQAVAIGEAQPPGNQTILYRAARTLALVQAERGDTDAAARKLDELITQAEAIGSPAMCGSLHEARARVALSADDRPAFLHHCHMVDAWFRPTRNPVLIARYERLVESGETSRPISEQQVAQEVTRRASAAMDPLEMLKRTVRTLIAQSSSPAERTARALEFLVQAASAASGYLYTSREGQLVLVAPSYGDEPPDIVLETLEQAVARILRGEAPADDTIIWKQHGKTARFRPVVLVARPRGKPAVVGAAALVEGGTELRAADPELVETVAQSLYDAGDATSEIMRVGRPIMSDVGPGTGEA
jgi:tetratricopeptide (TPR) repeat protein